jgi:probable F420-dependent oxidoreductase
MADPRPFRFGIASFQETRSEILAEAHRAQELGYDILLMPDHWGLLGTMPLLMMIADHIPRMRVGIYVLTNDFHHPVVMAKDAATLDVLSDGRLDLGLGAGYLSPEYEAAGIPFESSLVRFERLVETVKIAKLAFAGETFSFEGAHYQVRDYTPYPPSAQRPCPPLLLGGGRLLSSFAAAEADIVSIIPASARGGGLRSTQLSLQSLKRQADRRAAAAAYLHELGQRLDEFALDGEVTVDDLLESPYLAFGTDKDIAEHLLRIREQTGVSYFGVMGHLLGAFEPVISQLANPR